MNKWIQRFGLVMVGTVPFAFGGASAHEGVVVQRQDPATYKVTTPFIIADGSEAATPALPGCKFLGVWRGGYFSSGDVSVWADDHMGFRDWVAEYQGEAGFDGEIVLVQRSTLNSTTIPFDDRKNMSHLQTPSDIDLASGFDVYVCKRPKPVFVPPLVTIQSLSPLTIRLTPQPGTAITGNFVFVSPPGMSEFNSFTVPVNVDAPITGPTEINTGRDVPVVPVVAPDLKVNVSPAPQHTLAPRAVSPLPNNRTGFVFEVTPNQTMWRPIFRLTLAGAPGPFDFPGPRIFNAFDPQIITLNLPNNLVPAGTALDDAQLTIPSSSPLNQAPPEARVFNRGPIFSLTGNGAVQTFQSTLYNPLNQNVTFSNDSVGLVFTKCETGQPMFSVRAPLNQAIPAGDHLTINYDLATRVDLGGGNIPPFPDPLSPNFEEELFEWFDDICIQSESRPALTLP